MLDAREERKNVPIDSTMPAGEKAARRSFPALVHTRPNAAGAARGGLAACGLAQDMRAAQLGLSY
jgi:hypothetical protein